MKKRKMIISIFFSSAFCIGGLLFGGRVNFAEENLSVGNIDVISKGGSTFAVSDEDNFSVINLATLKNQVEVPHEIITSPRVGGYIYKNIRWSETNRKQTYVGTVSKSPGFSWGITHGKGFITIGGSYSETRTYKEYIISSRFTSVWGVYDQYSGNYIRSETFTSNVSYRHFVRV